MLQLQKETNKKPYMINTLRLTHLIYLGWVGLHVSVYIDHPQAHL